jgi:hypothetical protein
MKQVLLVIIFAFFSKQTFCQEIIFTTGKLGALRLGLSVDSINKFIDKKIVLKPSNDKDEYNSDTVQSFYKGVPLRLIFSNYHESEKKINGLLNS